MDKAHVLFILNHWLINLIKYQQPPFLRQRDSYEQPIKNSSYIEAIVEVYRVIDEYSIYVKSDISDRKILIDFESRVSYNKGDMIYVEGELKIDDFKVIKNSKKV